MSYDAWKAGGVHPALLEVTVVPPDAKAAASK